MLLTDKQKKKAARMKVLDLLDQCDICRDKKTYKENDCITCPIDKEIYYYQAIMNGQKPKTKEELTEHRIKELEKKQRETAKTYEVRIKNWKSKYEEQKKLNEKLANELEQAKVELQEVLSECSELKQVIINKEEQIQAIKKVIV